MRKWPIAAGVLVALVVVAALWALRSRAAGFPRTLRYNGVERCTILRELARYRVTGEKQQLGPLHIPHEVRAIAVAFEGRSRRASGMALDYDFEIETPFGGLLVGGSGHSGSRHGFLETGPIVHGLSAVGVPYAGDYPITCTCTPPESLDSLDLVIYEAAAETAPGRPVASLDDAIERYRADPSDAEALRFLRTQWTAKAAEADWARTLLEATYRPALRVRRISKIGAPIGVAFGAGKERPGFFRGPYGLDVGVLIDGERRRHFRELDAGGARGRWSANLGFEPGTAKLGVHRYQLHCILKRFPVSRHDPPVWTTSWTGEPIWVTLVEELPEGYIRRVSSPELDAQVRAALALDDWRGGFWVKRGSLNYPLRAVTAVPVALGHRFWVSVDGAEPVPLYPDPPSWLRTSGAWAACPAGSTGRVGEGRYGLALLKHAFGAPGRHRVKVLLRPDDAAALCVPGDTEFWGGTHESEELEVDYRPPPER